MGTRRRLHKQAVINGKEKPYTGHVNRVATIEPGDAYFPAMGMPEDAVIILRPLGGDPVYMTREQCEEYCQKLRKQRGEHTPEAQP